MDRNNPQSGVARAKKMRLITGGLWSDNAQPASNLPAGRAAEGERLGRRGAVVETPLQPAEHVLPEVQPTARESGFPVSRLFRRVSDYFRRAIAGRNNSG
ncbi:hypothetical protein CDAR_288851 [Caerostris darwini]|uniref:Uncharacterized protein n=1 Tax=Caerostris darwini TaxID=1538125 RepID=A0AAV4Q6G3_9ARAC|nr:hypothetical protein CDAR_288851 [Caerostris darwini]